MWMKELYQTDGIFILYYFRLFTGMIMDARLLIKRNDAPAQAVLAIDPNFVKFSGPRLRAQYFMLVASGSV